MNVVENRFIVAVDGDVADVSRIQRAGMELELLGFKHAPAQCFADTRRPDARYLLAGDPAGAYYLTGLDNLASRDRIEETIQLLWKDGMIDVTSSDVDFIADQIGWERVGEVVIMRNACLTPTRVSYAFIRPRAGR